jgi:hypothetical protein
MDIAEAFYNQHSLAWISHGGVTYPQPFSDKGIDWLRTFGGGLLTTCGLSHAGGPESDSFGDRGLHGLIGNQPAEIISIVQPDLRAGKYDMSITGIIRETRPFGPSLELKRTISATLGEAKLRIHDEVINKANTAAPHMLLYHFNFGWPVVDEGTDILWNGKWHPRFEENAKIFKEGNAFKKVPAPLESHLGSCRRIEIQKRATAVAGELAALGQRRVCYRHRTQHAPALRPGKSQGGWYVDFPSTRRNAGI